MNPSRIQSSHDMAKPKKKLTAAQRAAKKQRKKDFMTVFMNGKQVRVCPSLMASTRMQQTT